MKNLDDIAKEHGIDNIDLVTRSKRSLHREKAAISKRTDTREGCRGNLRKVNGMSLTR